MISSFSFCLTSEGPLFVIKNIAALINNIGITDSKVSLEILLTSNVPIEDPVNANAKYNTLFFSTSNPFL